MARSGCGVEVALKSVCGTEALSSCDYDSVVDDDVNSVALA